MRVGNLKSGGSGLGTGGQGLTVQGLQLGFGVGLSQTPRSKEVGFKMERSMIEVRSRNTTLLPLREQAAPSCDDLY